MDKFISYSAPQPLITIVDFLATDTDFGAGLDMTTEQRNKSKATESSTASPEDLITTSTGVGGAAGSVNKKGNKPLSPGAGRSPPSRPLVPGENCLIPTFASATSSNDHYDYDFTSTEILLIILNCNSSLDY